MAKDGEISIKQTEEDDDNSTPRLPQIQPQFRLFYQILLQFDNLTVQEK